MQLTVDGRVVEVVDDTLSLLEAIRDVAGVRSPKDGCSPQGQCGCCTVLVDGAARVACVTPVRRVAGRTVTTLDGLPADRADRWAAAFCATGASQCGFCTPGIIVRLDAASQRAPLDPAAVEQALLAHLCRCTGWQTIIEAAVAFTAGTDAPDRDLVAASRRATLEGRASQRVEADVALGRGGFADDGAPRDAVVAVSDGGGGWILGESLSAARAAAGKIQGRHTTEDLHYPVAVPEGDWDVTLQTTWVDPAYLETDAAWCVPGGEPATPLANGGAFGGKVASPVGAAARGLADRDQRAVRVVWSREDTVRWGPKRPPLAAGVDRVGRRIAVRVVTTEAVAKALRSGIGAGVEVDIDEVEVPGPPTSLALRGAGWAEGVVLRQALSDQPLGWVEHPEGGRALAEISADGTVLVRVDAGAPLDEVVLRSYAIGAAHQALGWVCSEGLTVAEDGTPVDLTVRSFGVLRAVDTPRIEVAIEPSDRDAVNGSDAVFAAVAAALWRHQDFAPRWPTGARLR